MFTAPDGSCRGRKATQNPYTFRLVRSRTNKRTALRFPMPKAEQAHFRVSSALGSRRGWRGNSEQALSPVFLTPNAAQR
ncbi:tryptophanyl-tRNA synthetase [Anopheles sinensis]|uniref:Tryptophanyl-tRNA synthetase n=1 Tax=Anopheles sinensis TaxID=74873 RepID=A0A084VSC1_ANOSI|nr:tryptophanyl-tRNA synthetase [Anopheles sinensis]